MRLFSIDVKAHAQGTGISGAPLTFSGVICSSYIPAIPQRVIIQTLNHGALYPFNILFLKLFKIMCLPLKNIPLLQDLSCI